MVCRRDWSSETGLARFVRWDYVGAPWGDGFVGNGGFSWRSRAAHLRVLQLAPPARPFQQHEDGYFSQHLRSDGVVAPADEARLFSIEGLPMPPRSGKPWGTHKPWAHMGGAAGAAHVLGGVCPGLIELMRLNEAFERATLTQTRSPTPTVAAPTPTRQQLEQQRPLQRWPHRR